MIVLGKHIIIVYTTNASLEKVEGIVVDETQNTFVIKTDDKELRVQKQCCTFKIGDNIIEGSTLLHRPEERLKKWKK
jgi:RNase P/RNase MRP subunit p29